MVPNVARRIEAFDHWLAVARFEGVRDLPQRPVLHSLARGWDGGPLGTAFGRWGPLLADMMLAADAGHPQPLEAARERVTRGVPPVHPTSLPPTAFAPRPGQTFDPRPPAASPGSAAPAGQAQPQGAGGGAAERLTSWLSGKGISLPEGIVAQLARAGANEKDVARRLPTRHREHAAEISQVLAGEGAASPAAPQAGTGRPGGATAGSQPASQRGGQAVPGTQTGQPAERVPVQMVPVPWGVPTPQGGPPQSPTAQGPASSGASAPGGQAAQHSAAAGRPPATGPAPAASGPAASGQAASGQPSQHPTYGPAPTAPRAAGQPAVGEVPQTGSWSQLGQPPTQAAAHPSGQPAAPEPSAAGRAAAAADPQGVIASLADAHDLMERMASFAPMTYEEVDEPLSPVTLRYVAGQGGARLTWPTLQREGQVVLLRVVSGEGQEPLSPDHADPVAIVTGGVAYDPRPLRSAVRHYQVWATFGSTEEDARWAEPQLHAQGAVVAPPWNLEIRPEGSTVVGKWEVAPGIQEVVITRVPRDALSPAALQSPENRVEPGTPHLNGFFDRSVQPGRAYMYRVVATATVAGALQRSTPVDRDVTTTAELLAVTGLTAELEADGDGDTVRLRWEAPATGTVRLYRTQDRPDLPTTAVAREILPQAGLADEAELPYPVTVTDGVTEMAGVPSLGWSRVYFTAVTTLEDRAVAAPVVSVVVPGRVRSARVVERGHSQVVTLGWPEGASAIHVYLAHQQVPVAEAVTGRPTLQLSQQQYRLQGGIHFSEPLDARGTEIHLVPVSYDAEGVVVGSPYTLSYHGRYRIQYDISAPGGLGGMFSSGRRLIRLWAEQPFPELRFVLVHNPDRLPLHVEDGTIVHTALVAETPQPPQPAIVTTVGPQLADSWATDLGQLRGWLRLFAVGLSPDQQAVFALLDPDPGKLLRR